jgi:ATP-dependent DNA helicase DinG
VPEPTLHETLDAALESAVAITTGRDDAQPRPGQVALAHDALTAMLVAGQAAGAAPTGVGKSLAYSIPAALLAAKRHERTVIATESLNLQSQLVEKDLPVVVEAVERVTGSRPQFALLKGWANYVCAASTYQAACDIQGIEARPPTSSLKALTDARDALAGFLPGLGEVDVVKWALEENIEERSGDRAGLTIDVTDEAWYSVSTTSAECPGALQCPFGDVCRPGIARENAGEADIIVTNHAMLAIQAATTVKVVIGNKTIGPVHHLVVDEAHGLANTVRSQGATVVNAARLFDVLRSIEHLHSGSPGKTKALRVSGMEVMKELDTHLSRVLRGKTSFTIAPKDECLGDGVSELVLGWLDAARRLVPRPDSSVVLGEIRARCRAISKIDVLKNAVGGMATDAMNVARWVESDNRFNRTPVEGLESISGATLRLSPVDVGPMLRSNLYEVQLGTYASTDDDVEMDVPEEALPMSVVVLSATLPQSSVVDLGIVARRVEYPSPFTVAFANSALFVPKASTEDLAELCFMENGKYRFDTSRHVEWASRYINDLVAANGGSALVLSATTNAGKRYAEALRKAHPNLTVFSQWDGGSTKSIVQKWKDDHSSILVGTRSLMTGVDNSGNSCTLVIIDRVPRSAGNPVDDARVSRISERLEIDRWSSDRFVYVGDASLLMTQAAGRLIRSITDSGLVAVLDARLLKSAPNGLRYPEPTRQIYMSSFEAFATKIADPKQAFEWIASHRARTAVSETVETV